jgi:hypothetical protein
MTVTLPLLYTGSYLKRTPGLGNLYVGSYTAAGGGGTVLDNLVNPPATAVAAENASLADAQAVGTTSMVSTTHGKSYYTPVNVTAMVKKNWDFVMQFYLNSSIQRDSSGNIVF